ncbi:hypothetical protein FH972_023920 [Carpinus fangiana]|uniref:Uncharacterized protein n=1 Tax=Carpinus fangiana TaxID=176857 RepID=A0A5N6KWU2_9ROSI|nr:hypothetical protein FH972_023920 [Carpinus fangiana]
MMIRVRHGNISTCAVSEAQPGKLGRPIDWSSAENQLIGKLSPNRRLWTKSGEFLSEVSAKPRQGSDGASRFNMASNNDHQLGPCGIRRNANLGEHGLLLIRY